MATVKITYEEYDENGDFVRIMKEDIMEDFEIQKVTIDQFLSYIKIEFREKPIADMTNEELDEVMDEMGMNHDNDWRDSHPAFK